MALCGLGASTWQCSGATDNTPPPINTLTPVNLTPDGDGTILTDVVVNHYGVLAEDGLFGSNQIQLAPTTPVTDLALQPNDLLFIWQTQGVLMENRDIVEYGSPQAFNGTGRFELIGVSAVDATTNTVTLYSSCGGLRNTYTAGLTQVVRVPQYNSLLISAAATLRAKPWDGQSGGVIAVRIQTALTLDGAIDVSGSGFRGGALTVNKTPRASDPGLFYRTYNPLGGGIKGESAAGSADSYAAVGKYGRGAPVNGGGGGNTLLAGGGGGANGDNGAVWSGQGVMPNATANEKQAWSHDPGYVANNNLFTTSSGGGRGGYSSSANSNDPRVVPPEDARWGGDLRREHGGLGGRGVPNDPKSRVYLGGGGGAGDNYLSAGGAGGNGGGLVLLIADSITGSGDISANGLGSGFLSDFVSGGGGGGGGGTVIVAANTLGAVTISAVGGGGGGQSATAASSAAGPGGGGGGGYIATPQTSGATRTVAGGSPGNNIFMTGQGFGENGATAGAAGLVTTLDNKIYGGLPFCSGADLGVKLTPASTSTMGRDPTPYTIAVTNLGPSPAKGITVSLSLPDTAQIQQAQGEGWTCTTSDTTAQCQLASLDALASSNLNVIALPPPSVTAVLATAQVSATSVDPSLANNTDQASIDITDPLYPRGVGGGLSCQLGGRAAPPPWGALFALLGLARRRIGRRTARKERAY